MYKYLQATQQDLPCKLQVAHVEAAHVVLETQVYFRVQQGVEWGWYNGELFVNKDFYFEVVDSVTCFHLT